MKNKKIVLGISGVAIFVAGILTMASCSLFSLQGITTIENIPGSLTVVVSDASVTLNETSSFRTIVPSFSSSVQSYLVTCTQGGSIVATETLTSQSYTFSNLPLGTVSVNVNAYNDEATQTSDTLIASGSSEVTLTSGSAANVLVSLDYAQSTGATGSLNYTIKWPEGSADSFQWKIDGGIYSTVTPDSSVDGFFTSVVTQPSISVGTHSLLIQFSKDGAIAGYAYESVNVYDNLESSFVVGSDGGLSTMREFSSEEITSTGTDVGAFVIAGGNADYISLDSANLNATYNFSTVNVVTVIPLVGESGQAISYTWQSGIAAATDSVTITSGSPISLTLAISAGTESSSNILTLNVTAANENTTETYTITMLSPIYVANEAALTDAFTDLSNNIVLMDDIDLSDGIDDWTPVGSNDDRFTGTFDGGGFSITGLTINISTGDAGLFSATSSTACISNVRLVNVSVSDSSTGDGIGALVGENFGTITNCSVSGTVTGATYVGGLVGNNRDTGIITECYSTATVSASTKYAGGLVGGNWSAIENCYARSAVSLVSAGDNSIGGLLGKSYDTGTVTNCYSSGTVSHSTAPGGLIGVNDGTCTSGYYNSELCGISDDTGKGDPLTTEAIRTQTNFTDWDFTDIWAIDSDVNTAYPYLRAIPPEAITVNTSNASTATELYDLINSDLSADYILAENLDIGGTEMTSIGSSKVPFSGSFDGGGYTLSGLSLTVDTADRGLFTSVGYGAKVKNLYLADVSISGDTTSYKGGLAAYNYGTIYRCTSSGSVEGNMYVGGLIGLNCGTISESWSNATVDANYYTGGLVGANGNSTAGIIENCYARGAVTIIGGGGLVGSNIKGTISHSYAAGPVLNSDGDSQAFVGKNEATASIDDCHYDESKIVDSYEGGGLMTSGFNGTPQTGIEMRTQTTFDSWDFTESTGTWVITRGKNGGYPYLQNVEPTSDTEISSALALGGITNLAGDYILTASVDSLGSCTIGDTTTPFIGSFDGNDNTISGLEITSGTEYLGLFGSVGTAGFIRNVILEEFEIDTSGNNVGALVGQNEGTLYKCTCRGFVKGNSYVGGLVGKNSGLIQACSARGNVRASSSQAGGLSGQNTGTISESFAFGGVYAETSVGGLIGIQESESDALTSNCYSRGVVVASSNLVGGFIGTLDTGTIENSYSATGVSYSKGSYSKAFVGSQLSGGTITDSYYDSTRCGFTDSSTGLTLSSGISTVPTGWDVDIWSHDSDKNGGYPYLIALTPANDIGISDLDDLNNIAYDSTADYYLENDITLDSNDAFSTLFTTESDPFTGTFDGNGYTITNISSGTESSDVGMLFKYVGIGAIIERLVLKDAVTDLTDNATVGLLCGKNEGTIYRCASSGSITTTATSSYLNARICGGLVGKNNGLIAECYSTADVLANSWVGGLVGSSDSGVVLNSYARGAVTSERETGESAYVGGFLGVLYYSTILNSYSAGAVTYVSGNDYFGGFLSTNYNGTSTITSCFYDNTVNSDAALVGVGTPSLTTDMQTMTTFSDWYITDSSSAEYIWGIDTVKTINNGYPYLQWAGEDTIVP